jgi:hypothetical protein
MIARQAKQLLIITTGFVVILVSVAIVLGSGDNSASSPILPVAFIGYSNDASGARLAIFAVTNLHPRQIDYSVTVELKEMNVWRQPAPFKPPNERVGPHQRSTFTVVNPVEGTWRVALLYQKTPTERDEIGLTIRRFFDRFKLYSIAKRVPTEKFKGYTIYSSEMTD